LRDIVVHLITRNSVAPEQVAAGGPGTTPTTSASAAAETA